MARLEIYEVVRILEGHPVFQDEHYQRMKNSLALVGKSPVVSPEEFRNEIMNAVRANGIRNQNLRIAQFREEEETEEHFEIYPVESVYPSEREFEEGVEAGLLRAEREKPQAKIYNRELRARADQLIKSTGVKEVLLVNRSGEITEGSRSNVFFVRNGAVFAAPQDTVLPGITRLKVLELIREHGISYSEKPIREEEIGAYDAVFLTGTSKEVLPVSRIREDKYDYEYDVNDPLVRSLMKWYREIEKN